MTTSGPVTVEKVLMTRYYVRFANGCVYSVKHSDVWNPTDFPNDIYDATGKKI